jgi:hypothetical protein
LRKTRNIKLNEIMIKNVNSKSFYSVESADFIEENNQ